MSAVLYITITNFCQESGYTEDAVNTKIRDGVWLEGKVWVHAPDNRRLISIEGYNLWVEMAAALHKRQKRAMKSPSPLEGYVAANESNSKRFAPTLSLRRPVARSLSAHVLAS